MYWETKKIILFYFTAIFTSLQRSGTKPAISLRHDCTKNLSKRTLIISVRWHSGSRPAIGKILIFCVFEHLSASDRVIFLCVALSVEWGLKEMNKNVCLPDLSVSSHIINITKTRDQTPFPILQQKIGKDAQLHILGEGLQTFFILWLAGTFLSYKWKTKAGVKVFTWHDHPPESVNTWLKEHLLKTKCQAMCSMFYKWNDFTVTATL